MPFFFRALRPAFVLATLLAVVLSHPSISRPQTPGSRSDLFSPDVDLIFEHITVNEGLPENSVRAILQDRTGFMWFGTMNGLVRYDGYEMEVFGPSSGDSASFGGRTVLALHEDSDGDIWIGTFVSGLWKYHADVGTFESISLNRNDSNLPEFDRVNDINEDSQGNIWVGMPYGLASIDRKSGVVTWHDQVQPLETGGSSSLNVSRVFPDDRGRIWCATEHNGIIILDPESGRIQRLIHDPTSPRSLPGNIVYDVLQTDDGKTWVTTQNGLALWQESTGDFIIFQPDPGRDDQVTNFLIRCQADDEGRLWIGSATGLYVFDPTSHRFRFFTHQFDKPTSPVNGPVLSLFFDRSGILWAGSWHAGMNKVNPGSGGFNTQTFGSEANAPGQFSVDALLEDSRGTLWVGTGDSPSGRGLGMLYRRDVPGDPFVPVQPEPGSNVFRPVRSLMEAQNGDIWVGTFQGLWLYSEGHLAPFTLGSGPHSDLLSLADIEGLTQGPEGIFWIATFSGLFRWDPGSGSLDRFTHDTLDPHTISSNDVTRVHIDRADRVWVGTDARGLNLFRSMDKGFQRFFAPDKGLETVSEIIETPVGDLWLASFSGLVRFDPATGSTEVFGRDHGLPNDQVMTMLDDSQGRFWLSTGYGLARFDPETMLVKSFDKLDGLPDNEVKMTGLRDSRGLIHFGGRTGLVTFDPNSFEDSNYQPPTVITTLALTDSPIRPGPGSPLVKLVHLTDRVELDHDRNHLSLGFASLDFARPEQIHYRYMLEGLDPDWRTPGVSRHASYTNLEPGTYTFRVKGTNRDGVWSPHEASLVIRILPPWWQTWWAYLLDTLAVLGVVYTIFRQVIHRERMRAKLDIQRAEATQLQELDEMKSRFLTNITHEFRTPLTLIKTPLLKLQSETQGAPDPRFDTMIRNAGRLELLIDQLLDLSRLEAGRLPLNWQPGDCWTFLREFLGGFQSVATQRQIKLKIDIPEGNCPAWFDEDIGEKLVGNLVSNAVKYTPDAGRVTVSALVSDQSAPTPVPRFGRRPSTWKTAPARMVTIRVSNTGSYIPPHEQPRIFDRFYQSASTDGSGVGLALVKELTEWLGGSIELSSSPVTGTVFTTILPVFDHHPEDGPHAPRLEEMDAGQAETPEADPGEESVAEDDEPRILVVEDHPELRDFIKEDFSPEYRVLVAENGQEGLKIAVDEVPDLVLSDIMMPVMDGYELCRRLKDDERTSHIPIILLTARSEAESRHKGLSLGADDYVAKPFDAEDLRLRINNLIEQRRKLADSYERRLAILTPEVMPVTSADERFVAQLRTIIDSNIEDTDFKINSLCNEVGMSRSQLHRKLKAVTGKSTSDFVRSHRIQRAAQLFKGGYGNVTEVAYAVGFRNLSYFSRSFKEIFDLQPSEYLKQVEGQDDSGD